MKNENCDDITCFPFESRLSLRPLVKFWRSEVASDDALRAGVARQVLAEAEAIPDLVQERPPAELLEANANVVRSLLTSVFPPALWSSMLAAATAPFDTKPVIATDGFIRLNLLADDEANFSLLGGRVSHQDMYRGKALAAYCEILRVHYGVDMDKSVTFVTERRGDDGNTSRFYRLEMDSRFINVELTGDKPLLTSNDLHDLLANPNDLERWMRVLPPESFVFCGLACISATDVTREEALSRLKQDLLAKNALLTRESINHLRRRVRSFLGMPDIRLGIIALDRCESGDVAGARAIGKSILLNNGMPSCSREKESLYWDVMQRGESIVIEDLEESGRNTGFESRLHDEGIRNIFVSPLKTNDQTVGILEIGSPHVGDLNSLNSIWLVELSRIFATALQRSLDEQEDRIQALIKRQYTAIHPVVEWKFRKAAIRHIIALEEHGEVEWPKIRFRNVYPIYGMSDIRGSSTQRTNAIQADLAEQLGLALATVIAAATVRPRPSLDELGYRLSKHIEYVLKGLASGDESSLLGLLQREVEPLLDEFSTYSEDVASHVDQYRQALDPSLEIVYEERRKYEDSVAMLNEAMATYLEERDEEAQDMVPHFFERFQTDGVDYNIYAGQDLVESGQFNEMDLRNLRLWQLTTTAGMATVASKLKPALPVKLDVAHLVLVQSEPLDIRFREDEKKFDVDGAYNIRYEIVKKRIDKAHISGSEERLTQPGHVAIVYSLDSERDEYLRHIDYLTASGYFVQDPELLNIEDLPGANGLRAIRVRVAEDAPGRPFLSLPESSQKPVFLEE
ncbi:MAG: hypothetical protein COV99_01945 [Bacteroidetes bacterium CG12_big_fil_rev_8_21_14_0_65_60_17]|nr:MAG: hypothetical protein COV99_01945 [Bacteroidetes bacterium CG12_big_fil_rev_8_21_14_0_65_60_17]